MQIRYSRDAVKFLEKQTKKNVERIREAIAKQIDWNKIGI